MSRSQSAPISLAHRRLDPFKVEKSDVQRGVHGNNERLSVENVGFGVHYLYDILRYAQ